jgi:hypothetical protein
MATAGDESAEPVPAYGTPGAAYVVGPGGVSVRGAILAAVLGLGFAGAVYLAEGLHPVALLSLACFVPLLLLIRDARDVRRRVVYFAADAGGIHFHAATDASGARGPVVVPWESIAIVTYFLVEDVFSNGEDGEGPRSTWHEAVGVTLTAEAGGDPDALAYHEVFKTFNVDPDALRAAVNHFGGGVRVIAGPDVAGSMVPPDLRPVIGEFLRSRRSAGSEDRPG